MTVKPTVLLAGATALIAVAGIGYWVGTQTGHPAHGGPALAPPERKVEFWYDPMHPSAHFEAPGKSPFMDMQLVPKYADAADSDGVRVEPRMVQNLGVRTAVVTSGPFDRSVRAVGRVEADERTIHRVTMRAEGWVEALHVRADGEHVQHGELLAEVYSPSFDTAQREFLLAIEAGDEALVSAARARLVALAVDARQIAALERTRQPQRRIGVYSPIDGYVMELKTRDGDAVARDAMLFEVASHDPIWIVADVPEASAAWIESGSRVVATTVANPGRAFEGQVDYVYPALDTSTRARRARAVFANADDALHPGMYADVVIDGGRVAQALLVPSEAVIRTGKRAVVIVAEAGGGYRPVEVDVGDERDGVTVVRRGLAAGDRIVVSGQFLIDSEANLRGVETRMLDADERTEAQP